MINNNDGQSLQTEKEATLVIEQFLTDNYLFRRNVLNKKVEFSTREQPDEWRTLGQEALYSIVLRAMREQVLEKGNPQKAIELYLGSEEVKLFDPIREYLNSLPAWDGQNRVAQLFSRIPGISSVQLSFLAVWIRSMVAHWLQLDTLHGNECVPLFIGAQGCGKTTFARRLLPAQFSDYYVDSLNLSNRFDKEMALCNNLLVNLDEFDAISPRQHPALKQTLSVSKINGRPIFGRVQEDRARYASFVGTTNNPHPLTDATGSRRYLCLDIPQGQLIDNSGTIDYEQLYAQVLYEIRELQAPYWFNNDEVARIQQLNLGFMMQKDIASMVEVLFRKPREGEAVTALDSGEMLRIIQQEYPRVQSTHSNKVQIGLAMKDMGYERIIHHHHTSYLVVPTKTA